MIKMPPTMVHRPPSPHHNPSERSPPCFATRPSTSAPGAATMMMRKRKTPLLLKPRTTESDPAKICERPHSLSRPHDILRAAVARVPPWAYNPWMERDSLRVAFGLTMAQLAAPILTKWPENTAGQFVRKQVGGETVMTPENAPMLAPTYASSNKRVLLGIGPTQDKFDPLNITLPAGRGELASIDELQYLLTVRHSSDVRKAPAYETMYPTPPITAQGLAAFLQALERCGLLHRACVMAGVGYREMSSLRKQVPQVNDLVNQAADRYRELLQGAAHDRGVDGWDEPVFGGKNKDEIVGYVKRYDSRMLELLLKRHVPEFREKTEVGVHVTGGVLVVPAPALSASDWATQHGGERIPGPGSEPTMIDAQAGPSVPAELPA